MRASVGDAIASASMAGPSIVNPASALLTHDDDPLADSPLLSHSPAEIDQLTFDDIPWVAFFTTPASLTLFLNHFVYSFIGFMLLTEIPAFLTDALGYDIESAGLLAVTPYAANFVSTMGFAMYFDKKEVCMSTCQMPILFISSCSQEEGWPARKVRQRSMQITFLGAGTCLVICGFLKSKGIN